MVSVLCIMVCHTEVALLFRIVHSIMLPTGDMANWSGMLQNTTFMNISNNIFVDSGNNQVIRRITNNNNNVIKSFSRNSYWYGENYSTDGSIATYESNPIETDPKLTDPGNAVETAKDFTPRGDEQLSARTGDPRWLP